MTMLSLFTPLQPEADAAENYNPSRINPKKSKNHFYKPIYLYSIIAEFPFIILRSTILIRGV